VRLNFVFFTDSVSELYGQRTIADVFINLLVGKCLYVSIRPLVSSLFTTTDHPSTFALYACVHAPVCACVHNNLRITDWSFVKSDIAEICKKVQNCC
jgi:hypothetical protein